MTSGAIDHTILAKTKKSNLGGFCFKYTFCFSFACYRYFLIVFSIERSFIAMFSKKYIPLFLRKKNANPLSPFSASYAFFAFRPFKPPNLLFLLFLLFLPSICFFCFFYPPICFFSFFYPPSAFSAFTTPYLFFLLFLLFLPSRKIRLDEVEWDPF